MIFLFVVLFLLSSQLIRSVAIDQQQGINPYPFGTWVFTVALHILLLASSIFYLGWVWGIILFLAHLFGLLDLTVMWILNIPLLFIKDPRHFLTLATVKRNSLFPFLIVDLIFTITSFIVSDYKALFHFLCDIPRSLVIILAVAASFGTLRIITMKTMKGISRPNYPNSSLNSSDIDNDAHPVHPVAPGYSGYHNMVAKNVMDILWRNTIDFIKNGWDSEDMPDLLFFWSAMYQASYDILLNHGLEESVLQELHAFLRQLEQSHPTNSNRTDEHIQFLELSIDMLKNSTLGSPVKNESIDTLELAHSVCGSYEDPADIPPVDAITIFEYNLAVANTITELSNLLSDKECVADWEKDAEREQTLKYIKEWDKVANIDELVSNVTERSEETCTSGKGTTKDDHSLDRS